MRDVTNDAPAEVRRELTSYGGKNQFGKSFWRLVIAEHRTGFRAGIEAPRMTDSSERPIYPCTGWILERWFPAEKFGTREWWEAQKGRDGQQLLGDYPVEGDYWMLAGPWSHLPNISELKDVIRRYEYFMDNSDFSETAMNAFVTGLKEQEDRNLDSYIIQRQYAIKHVIRPILNSLSLAASRLRQRWHEQWGIGSHIGAGG